MDQLQRPIGYWLKHLDRLIEASFERIFADEGLTRRDWQVLSTLDAAPMDDGGLATALGPFWGQGAVTLEKVLDGLSGKGWIRRGPDGRWTLTTEGESGRAGIAARVDGARRLVTAGISEAQYNATVATLRRMAGNLEGAVAR